MNGDDTTPRLEDLLAYQIVTLSRLVTRHAARYLAQAHDLALVDWIVVAHLAQESTMTLRDLVEKSHTDKAQLSRVAVALEDKGLIRREADPDDGRRVLFGLTPEGRRLFDSILPARQELNRDLLNQLSEKERLGLLAGIDKLTAYFCDLLATSGPQRRPAGLDPAAPAKHG